MPTVLLVRHGRTAANAGGVLAGRSPGVVLDESGRRQAADLAQRAASLPLVRVVSSPLERTVETAEALLAVGGTPKVPRPPLLTDDRLLECDYGTWTGRALSTLAKEPMWKVVQQHPSAAVFPGGEGLRDVQARAVAAVREHDAQVAAEHGDSALWVAVAHGDVLKAVLADALGMHLDAFQRIVVDPASVSVVRYTPGRPFVLMTNTVAGDLGFLVPAPKKGRRRASRKRVDSDAVVGGGAGPAGAAVPAGAVPAGR